MHDYNKAYPGLVPNYVVSFTKLELIQYYKSIINNKVVTDSYKLKIANAVLEFNGIC